ncbi:hypothetical protein F2P81_011585 [Scophthalmus maximus]|uniref:Uncharacterized protein n=1 Tax=Scophthalmus maximus TaxID=52904 RepID=A0A6A4SQK0_SCOMX|nr:hypothetical protein F2P81_011585 [Scophthalmus maximus]
METRPVRVKIPPLVNCRQVSVSALSSPLDGTVCNTLHSVLCDLDIRRRSSTKRQIVALVYCSSGFWSVGEALQLDCHGSAPAVHCLFPLVDLT